MQEVTMSDATLRLVIRIVLLIHAIGHLQGVVVGLGLFSTDSWHARSWLLTEMIGESPSRILALALWGVLAIGFLLVSAGAFGWPPLQANWRGPAVALAVLSLLTIGLYWNSFAMIFNKLGAIAVNAAAIGGILFAGWPSQELLP
jgi:hypothetical protein